METITLNINVVLCQPYDSNCYPMHHNSKVKKSDLLKYFCILQMNKNMKISLEKRAKGISKQSVKKK